MIDINQTKTIYFLAICGTAMSSLAAMLKRKGFRVYGTDDGVYPPMSTFLQEQDIPVYAGYDVSHLDPRPDLVVVGNAISRGNCEIEEILDRRIYYVSLPDAMRDFFLRDSRSIVVTGTHGKTTTSSLLAYIFDYAKRDPNFLIGGIPLNFGRGFQIGEGNEFIIEGDEYDSAFFDKTSKFLKYCPTVGIINGIEFDHVDIFSSLEEIKIAFRRFVNLIPRNGLLVINRDSEVAIEVSKKALCPVITYGLTADSDWKATNIRVTAEGTFFDAVYDNRRRGDIYLSIDGEYNIRNALAAVAVATYSGIDFETIIKACADFKGVRRRCELKGSIAGIDIYDDFGHHPTAIRETLATLRRKYPERRIWALFEPRSASTRRNIFQKAFVPAFIDADYVLVAPVYRVEQIASEEVLDVFQLIKDLCDKNKGAKQFNSIDDILVYLKTRLQKGDIIITFSNGSFGNIHQRLLTMI